MAAATIGSGLGIVLLGVSVPALAEPSGTEIVRVPYDLAAVTLSQPRIDAQRQPLERLDKPREDPAEMQGPGWTPPRKAWGRADKGPVLQVGALGSKDKRIPGLAHIAFDWDF
jgi:hypothetical protein